MYHQCLSATGYVAKKKIWQGKEREAAKARLMIGYEGFNKRTRDYLKARKPRQL